MDQGRLKGKVMPGPSPNFSHHTNDKALARLSMANS